MSVKIRFARSLWGLLFISLALWGAACNAATGEPANGTINNQGNAELQDWLNTRGEVDAMADSAAVSGEANAETAADTEPLAANPAAPESSTAVPALNANTASQAADASGIPVGFTEDGHPYKGNPDAPIIIKEFSDFQCPYCARWASQTFSSLLQNQIAAGEVVLIYYDFPLSSIHPQAAAAANAARCAGEQSAAAYWEIHDMLFSRVDEWANNNANTVFFSFGEELGLDAADFQECVQSNRYEQAVQADVALGNSRGVRSTPSFFLNEQMLVGAHPTETFNQAITALLNGETIAAAQPETPPQQQMPEPVRPMPAPLSLAEGDVAFAMGDPDAPAQIVEFTDYQCPYCGQHALQTLPRIMEEMVESGRVYYVIKDFPLDGIHPEARAAAKAARCAGAQEAYLGMHDAVFDAQTEWGGQGEQAAGVFARIAAELGLDAAAFDTCYRDTTYDDLVQANVDEALAFGVQSTPSFFFNGYLVPGAIPYSSFDEIVTLIENNGLEARVEANYQAALEQYQAQQRQQQQPQPAGPVEISTENAFAIGSPDAPVTIVEYTDFQCPFCARHFTQTFPQLKEKYIDTGIVRYVFKDFPLTSIHPQAVIAAEAARCAGEQNAYLEMHDTLFANQDEWNGRNEAATLFIQYATDMGLEPTPFTECLESHRYEDYVMADFTEGAGFGIQGTPTFFVNGHIFVGAQPFATFEQIIAAIQNQ